MASIKQFEDLEAWQKARELAGHVYAISKNEQFSSDFALKNQIRRSSIAVMSSIADGFNRDSNHEFTHCLGLAKGAAAEIKSLLYVALDQDYISRETFDHLCGMTTEAENLLGGLLRYLRSRPAQR